METHLAADFVLPVSDGRRAARRWQALAAIAILNVLVVGALWAMAVIGVGRYWMPVGYDLLQVAAGSVLLSQYLMLALWSSLSEPRSPLRWLLLVVVCALAGLIVAVVFFPVWQWQFVGSRWFSWGIVFWQLYVNWMLVLCSGIVFLLTADIVAWPFRRMLGCRIAFSDAPASTPAARGFGLTELFWWVGMAAAGCWLLRAMLENTLAETVAIVLIMLACVIPPSTIAAVAAFTARRRWLGFLVSIAFALAYGGALGGICWTITSIVPYPRNSLLAYLVYIPVEVMAPVVLVSALAAYANALALRWAGARLAWSMPALHRRSAAPLRS